MNQHGSYEAVVLRALGELLLGNHSIGALALSIYAKSLPSFAVAVIFKYAVMVTSITGIGGVLATPLLCITASSLFQKNMLIKSDVIFPI